MPAYETNAVTLRLSGYRGTCKQPWQWLHRAVTLGGQFFCSGCGVYLSGTTALFYRPRVHTLSQNPLIFFFFFAFTRFEIYGEAPTGSMMPASNNFVSSAVTSFHNYWLHVCVQEWLPTSTILYCAITMGY